MRQESAGVTEALLDSARREFMEHGFHGASLRRISADSGVSTNSIYTRFGDKAGLFAAVVGPVADGLMEYYLTCVDQAADTQDSSSAMETGGEGTDEVLQYIYQHFDVFYLIFCRSAGTEYEQYFDRRRRLKKPTTEHLPINMPRIRNRSRIFLSMWFAVPVGSIFMRSCHINFLLKKHRCLWTT